MRVLRAQEMREDTPSTPRTTQGCGTQRRPEASQTGHPDGSYGERVDPRISGFVCKRPRSHTEGLHFIQQASLRDPVDFRS